MERTEVGFLLFVVSGGVLGSQVLDSQAASDLSGLDVEGSIVHGGFFPVHTVDPTCLLGLNVSLGYEVYLPSSGYYYYNK